MNAGVDENALLHVLFEFVKCSPTLDSSEFAGRSTDMLQEEYWILTVVGADGG